MQQKDISELNITELEALGYQTLKELEIQKRNIETIERLIEQKKSEVQKTLEIKEDGC